MSNPLKVLTVSALLACAFAAGQSRADELLHPSVPGPRVTGKPAAVGVTLDFAKVLTFAEPARTIIIGNPGIVDGTLSDEHTIVLTGRALGTTNMIVLGDSGQEIANLVVHVGANTRQWTTVHHGAAQQVFSCAGPCKAIAAAAAAEGASAKSKE